jgi:predicted Zn-dependent peptidase
MFGQIGREEKKNKVKESALPEIKAARHKDKGQWDYDILSAMKLQPKQDKLANGLTVVTVPMETESVAAMLEVRVGARDETKKTNGISHFLEHMVFKGTKKWPKPTDMNKVIVSVGGLVNAYTSREQTCFVVKLPKKHLKLGLEFLQQAVFAPLLPKAELEKERGVVLEEFKMYEDNPMSKVRREYDTLIYIKTPLGRHVIGEPENIRRLKREQFFACLNRWYQPKNMVLGLAGGIGRQAREKAEAVFNNEKGGEVKFTDRPERLAFKQSRPRLKVINRDIQQAHFCLGLRTFERTNKDRYALGLLNTVLGENMSSRLFEEVREKRGLVYYVRSRVRGYFDIGDLVVQAGCDAKRAEEAVQVVKNEFFKLTNRRTGVTGDELKRAKEYAKGMIALSLEDSSQVASMFSEDLLLEGKLRTVEEIEQGIETVSQADITRVAKSIFASKRLNLAVVGPVKNKERLVSLLN